MCLILGFTVFFKCISNLKGKEWISMNSVHTEPGGIFGNVVFQPEIFPGRNDVSGTTKLLCQKMSLNRQYRDRLKTASNKFNHYYNV